MFETARVQQGLCAELKAGSKTLVEHAYKNNNIANCVTSAIYPLLTSFPLFSIFDFAVCSLQTKLESIFHLDEHRRVPSTLEQPASIYEALVYSLGGVSRRRPPPL
jgi:hypothetical protein